MSNNDNVIDENWSFHINITWWEILLTISIVTFVIYLIKRKRKR